ncbi:MAG: lipoyl(octanoyl) transferase LipB [Bdellovibrionales bacterium]|nr:lipoyl(octanoyl) transferase LipB [Bdellovibrionales bacterium]NQZ18337.1 lipoyl(octanoyl) transferase LipB [Bdellovibrionales bacterium]
MLSKRNELKLPTIEDWGLIPYTEAFEKQQQYVEEIIAGERGETIVFCHHEPVVTLGRGTKEGDVFSWKGETVEVNRGGRATYHGPNQVVMYPMIDLAGATPSYIKKKIKDKDLHDYMRVLEEAAIMTIRDYEVEAQGHVMQKQIGEDQEAEATGVWVNNQKIASIGIAVKKWVTSHGIAINLLKDEQAFKGINPCGFSTQTMVSLKELTNKRLVRETFQKELASNFMFSVYI